MTEPLEPDLQGRLQTLLEGRTVKAVRLTNRELFIEFSDGTHLFVDGKPGGELELSVT